MHIVFGDGRLGCALARLLSEGGGDVVLLDESEVGPLDGIRHVKGGLDSIASSLGPGPHDVYLVRGPEENARLASMVDERLPGSRFIGIGPPDLWAKGGTLVDPDIELSRAILGEFGGIGDEAMATALGESISGVRGRASIFVHSNPDPDALASAVGIQSILSSRGVESDVYYDGKIGREENKKLVRYLGLPLHRVDAGDQASAIVSSSGCVVLVDCAIPGENNAVPQGAEPNLVVDHHVTNRDAAGRDFTDIRPGIAATSSIVAHYLRVLGVTPGPRLAAALLYGIKTDSMGFTAPLSSEDIRAIAYLSPLADNEMLHDLEVPSIAQETMDVIARAIQNREREGPYVLTCVDYVDARDDLSKASEFLIREAGSDVVVVYGIVEDAIHVSARGKDPAAGLGDLLKRAFGHVGAAGGHATSAGAQIPLHVLNYPSGEDQHILVKLVKDTVEEMFLSAAGVVKGGSVGGDGP